LIVIRMLAESSTVRILALIARLLRRSLCRSDLGGSEWVGNWLRRGEKRSPSRQAADGCEFSVSRAASAVKVEK
jgi:hypothetical protein